MTREQAKLAFLASTSVPFPSGECFDAGYDEAVKDVLLFLWETSSRVGDSGGASEMVYVAKMIAKEFRSEPLCP